MWLVIETFEAKTFVNSSNIKDYITLKKETF